MNVVGEVPRFMVEDFGLDSAGKPLRYKIIVKEDKIAAIMYNTGNRIEELTFVEHQFNVNDLGIPSHDPNSLPRK